MLNTTQSSVNAASLKKRLVSVNQQVIQEMSSLQQRIDKLLAGGVEGALQGRLLDLRQGIEVVLNRIAELQGNLKG